MIVKRGERERERERERGDPMAAEGWYGRECYERECYERECYGMVQCNLLLTEYTVSKVVMRDRNVFRCGTYSAW